MAKNLLFNSPFEMGLRIMSLLSVTPRKSFSVDRIIGFDFITCYADDFGLPYPNLHGLNNYKYGEIVSRRILVQEAVKELVTSGMLNIKVDRGYLFSVSDAGEKYAKTLKSDYANDYREIAKCVVDYYKKNSDADIFALVQAHSVHAIRG